MKAYQIIQQTVSTPQGSWRWQRRGACKLYAVPALFESFHPLRKGVIKLAERHGALGVTSQSKYAIQRFCRADVEQFATNYGLALIPAIGGEFGPWITKSA